MRQVIIQVPAPQSAHVSSILENAKADNIISLEKTGLNSDVHSYIAHIENRYMDNLIEDIQSIEHSVISIIPQGVMVLEPPPDKIPSQLTNVKPRSSLEVYLSALQSISSWASLLYFSVIAGVLVWLGLITNTTFLLVAAMLIAPFVGPAMNTAIATAKGDLELFKKSISRYFFSIFIAIATSSLLSIIFQIDFATDLMVSISEVSRYIFLVPIMAGFAGALILVQAERNNLISGAASGILVAATLAPPSGLVGIGLVLQDWEMVRSGLFLLSSFLVGINISGTALFYFYGNITPNGFRYQKGKTLHLFIITAVSTVLFLLFLGMQLFTTPQLERTTIARAIKKNIRDTLNANKSYKLIDVSANFTGINIKEQNSVICQLYVQMESDSISKTAAEKEIKGLIKQKIKSLGYHVTPFVSVTVFDATSNTSPN